MAWLALAWLGGCGLRGQEVPPTPPVDVVACDTAVGVRSLECQAELGEIRDGALFTLHDQCVLFPQRRHALVACDQAPDCEAFAACHRSVAPLDLAASPELCHAFVLRRKIKDWAPLQEWVYEERPAQRRREMVVRMSRLGALCESDRATRQQVLACMQLERQAFATCVWEAAEALPP